MMASEMAAGMATMAAELAAGEVASRGSHSATRCTLPHVHTLFPATLHPPMCMHPVHTLIPAPCVVLVPHSHVQARIQCTHWPPIVRVVHTGVLRRPPTVDDRDDPASDGKQALTARAAF